MSVDDCPAARSLVSRSKNHQLPVSAQGDEKNTFAGGWSPVVLRRPEGLCRNDGLASPAKAPAGPTGAPRRPRPGSPLVVSRHRILSQRRHQK